MDVGTLRAFLLWCTVIDYALLIVWFAAFALAHDWHYRLTTRWFAVSREQYDLVSFAGIAFLKIVIIVFNVVPLVALSIIGR